MRIAFYILTITFFGCSAKDQGVCDWKNYLESINNVQAFTSIHPSENVFKPALKSCSQISGLKLMLQDFRQFEFVSVSYKPIILSDIDSIRKIKKLNTIKNGQNSGFFNKVYIRNKIAAPIDSTLTLSDLRNIFATDFVIDSLIITNCDLKCVDNGFSFILHGIPFYGVTDAQGKIILLGILEVEPQFDTKENHDKIKQLLIDKGLLLVAWNSESVLETKDFE